MTSFQALIGTARRRSPARTAPESPPPEVPTNLLGHWELDEPSGTTADDETATDNDGTYNDVTLGEDAIYVGGAGSARFVPSGPSYVQIPHDASYEVDAWTLVSYPQIEVSLGIGEKQIIAQKDSPGQANGWELSVTTDVTGDMRWTGFTKTDSAGVVRIGGSTTGVGTVTANTAYKVALSVNEDGTMRLRVDGSELDVRSGGGGMALNDDDICLGMYLPNSAAPLGGWVGGVRLYEGDLDDTTLDALPAAQRKAVRGGNAQRIFNL